MKPRLWRSAAVAAAVCLLAPAAAGAKTVRKCHSADLRYPLQPGGPDDFGVFRLRIAGGRCATAHRVAKAWQKRFEANVRKPGPLKLPRHVRGFVFTTLAPTEAQQFRLRGRRGATTIRFNYFVPNG
jgi:hypothetical protein